MSLTYPVAHPSGGTGDGGVLNSSPSVGPINTLKGTLSDSYIATIRPQPRK